MIDPRMPTDPAEPSYAWRKPGVCGWRCLDFWDHVWPWRRGAPKRHPAWHAVSISLALAVTLAWVLAALGELRAGAVIAWWFGWSVYEVLIRLNTKPYVKDGPWWGRRYRVAGVMDMVCYVAFKNLLVGATLFLVLKALGWLVL
jgi:hypothetical protein